jgi:hypothetical protein
MLRATVIIGPGRPPTPLDISERELLIRIAGLAGAVMTSLRRPGRGRYSSENQLRGWLKGEVSFSASDLAPALGLLELTGKLIRPEVPPKSPRPGRLAKGAEVWAQMDAAESFEGIANPIPAPDIDDTSNEVAEPCEGVTESVARKDMDAALEPLPALSEDAVELDPAAVDELAKAIIRSFSVTGRGHDGNRNLCPHEDLLREWLQADGMSFDDGFLSAALARLETATVPGYNVRLVRGTELHRRNRSIWVPAEHWPDRAMLLDPLSPWDSATYEPSDIVPYLIPAGSGDT